MKIAVNKIHFPVTSLGYGRRVGIWLQGCSIRCRGCLSRDTWLRRPEHYIEVDRLVAALESQLIRADGVTVSGGEPFDQPEPLCRLFEALRGVCPGDILVYSGYSMGKLKRLYRRLLEQIDVVITGPYRPSAGQSLVLRGSDNQRIFLQSEMARDRYPADIDQMPWPTGRRLNFAASQKEAWFAGIPCTGAMPQLRRRLQSRGIQTITSDQASKVE